MIKWPDSLQEDLARRRAILFLGSGISANSVNAHNLRPPTWHKFLLAALERCDNPRKHIASLIKRSDYLTACEVLRHRLDEEWNKLLNQIFTDPEFPPAEIHKTIFLLDSRLVLTVNFDKIYDTYSQQASANSVHVKHYYDDDVATFIRDHRYLVLKAHGTIDRPERMIFTREQYARAQYEFSGFYSLLDSLITTHTFLFLGCGISDPDVQMLLSRHANMFPGSKPHYMCLSSRSVHDDVELSLRRNYNLKVLRYSANNGHKELHESLQALVQLVDERRTKIADEQSW